MKALNGRILCENIPEPKKQGSIYLPDKTKGEIPSRARVVDVGMSCRDKVGVIWEPPCKEGDIVYFRRAREQKIGELLGIWFEDVIAIEKDAQIKAPYNYLIIDVTHKETYGDLIIIPDQFRKHNAEYWGVVLDIGSNFKHKEVKVGQKIIFPRNEGFPIKFNDKDLYSLRERWVEAILDE